MVAVESVLRAVVVACQAITIVITWPLWQAREEPALLPLVDMGPLDFGIPLLVTLAVALRWPLVGAVAHSVVLFVAILADQTREQPQMLSLAVLLWATLPSPACRSIGALHLIALWLWSGIGKLVSSRFIAEGGTWLLLDRVSPGSSAAVAASIAMGAGEVTLAVLALSPRTRSLAARLGCGLHVAILVYLSLVRGVNPAVWSWNLALAVAAPILLGRGRLSPLFPTARLAPRIAVALLVVLPVGEHAGFIDAPLGHRVYTLAGPHALWLRVDGRIEPVTELAGLRVMLPPVPRIYREWFDRTARRGDRMVILEERWLARVLGSKNLLLRYKARGTGNTPR